MVIRDYQASFDLLLRDTEALLEYVEPTNDNLPTYSHRLYWLLLRTCTDFESLAKDQLIAKGCPKSPEDMTVNDYKMLGTQLRIEGAEVDFLLWQPEPRRVLPFKGWSVAKPVLPWYAAYNNVKHNRRTEFRRANLGVFVEALAGQFVLIARVTRVNPPDDWVSYCTQRDGKEECCRKPFRVRWDELGGSVVLRKAGAKE